MSHDTALAAVKSTLQGVANIGNVHDYVRWHKDWPNMLTMFKVTSPTSQIRTWDISRKSTSETEKACRTNLRVHDFRIRGFMSLDDSAATEKTFQTLLEAVAAAFRNKPTFSGTVLIVDPLQIENVDHVMVGDVLCHMAECSLRVTEEIQWTE